MLSDPLPLTWAPTIAVSGGTVSNLRRVANGRYVGVDSPFTLDTQARFSATPTIKAVGYSTARTRLEVDNNVPGAPLGATPLPDDTCTSDFVIKYNPRSHAPAYVLSVFDSHYSLARANMVRFLAGES